jgi:hypothetical protein
MATVIQEELIAGRISARTAKAQLAINFEIAIDEEIKKAEKRLAHTSLDWKRNKALDESIYCREIRRSY